MDVRVSVTCFNLPLRFPLFMWKPFLLLSDLCSPKFYGILLRYFHPMNTLLYNKHERSLGWPDQCIGKWYSLFWAVWWIFLILIFPHQLWSNFTVTKRKKCYIFAWTVIPGVVAVSEEYIICWIFVSREKLRFPGSMSNEYRMLKWTLKPRPLKRSVTDECIQCAQIKWRYSYSKFNKQAHWQNGVQPLDNDSHVSLCFKAKIYILIYLPMLIMT